MTVFLWYLIDKIILNKIFNIFSILLFIILLQTHHVDSTLKRRGSGRFHIVSTWNPRGLFVGFLSVTKWLDVVVLWFHFDNDEDNEPNDANYFAGKIEKQTRQIKFE